MSARQKRSYSAATADPRPTRRRKYSRDPNNTVANYNRAFGLVPSYRGFTPRAFSQGEWKYLDVNVSNVINTTVGPVLCNGLQPGSGATQRIGQKICIKSIELRGYYIVTPGTGVDQVQRRILLLDKQANGAAPAAADFLTPANVLGFRNLNNRKRFKVIKDNSWHLSASAESGSQRVMHTYIKFPRGIIVDYNAGVAGTVADISSNALYYVTVGSEAPGATAGSGLVYCRIRYTDM